MMADGYIDVDPDTGEVIEPSTVVDVYTGGYRPTLVLAPQAAREMVEQVKELQRSVLVQGSDYMTIPGTAKPSLLKPGAERLLMVFGLGHHMDRLDLEQDDAGRNVGVTYRCTVTRAMPDGSVITVSSCDGHASHEEPKWKRAPWNTVLKMAQKRALVGAALTATATSGLFTQDVEDYDRPSPRGGRTSSDTAAPSSGGDDPNLISKAQLGMMLSVMAEVGITDRAIRLQFVCDLIGRPIESSKELTKREASTVIDRLKGMAAEEAGDA